MNFQKYVNTYPYPTSADFKTTYYYKNGALVAKSTINKLDHIIPEVPLDSCTKEVVLDKEGFYNERNKYNENTMKLYQQFKDDLADELGLTNHPKWDKLFEIAWEEGHGDGYEDVYYYAEKLSELLN